MIKIEMSETKNLLTDLIGNLKGKGPPIQALIAIQTMTMGNHPAIIFLNGALQRRTKNPYDIVAVHP